MAFSPRFTQMDDDGSLGFRNWGYYEQPLKGNLGLQLMPGVAERDKKPLLSNGGGGFLHRECAIPEPSSMPIDFVRDGWIHHARENKLSHMIPMNHHNHNHHHHHSYSVMPPDPVGGHTLQMMQQQQQPEPPKEDNAPPQSEEPKKRPQARTNKSPKPKKPKKAAAPRDEASGCPVSRTLVINGIDLDISGIPTPVCSCTGVAQQCYKWGAGGWQSACCTTNMSEYPLPMSTKRRGARIAGRKMSLGAFKKVLEKLAGEGYNLSNPIDLKTFWAKHGTNKFATIR